MMATELFERLLRASWQAAVLVALVLVAQWVFQKQIGARWRFALWTIVLVRLLLPVSMTSPWSLFNLVRPNAPAPTASLTARGEESPDSRGIAAPDPVVISKSESARFSSGSPASQPITLPAPGSTDHTAKNPLVPSFTKRQLLEYGTIAWVLGVTFLISRLAVQNIRFARRLRSAEIITEPAILKIFEACRKSFRSRARVRLAQTNAVSSPALYGLFRPVLLVPRGMIANFDRSELRYVFLHELAHVERRDMALHWLATALKVLHWFNPVLWFAFRRMAADRELACDELALSRAGERENRQYGETIIKLLDSCARPEPLPGVMGILEDRDQMVRRISMIAKFRRNPRWPVFGLLLLAALGVVSLTDARPQQAQAPPPATTPVTQLMPASPSAAVSATDAVPLWNGKPAGEWLAQIDFRKGLDDPQFVEAIAAFRAMGGSAVPFLRANLTPEPTLAQSRRSEENRRRAAWVLDQLGPVAEPAFPDLVAALEAEDYSLAAYAAMALSSMGPDKARAAVPALMESFRYGNGQAGIAVAEIAPANPELVPLLIEGLKRGPHSNSGSELQVDAARALGKLGFRAKAAIPALESGLKDENSKFWAASALQKIAADQPDVLAEANAALKWEPQPHPPIPELIAAVANAHPGEKGMPLQNLGQALDADQYQGHPASEEIIRGQIVPLVTAILDSGNGRDIGSAAWILNRIGDDAKQFAPRMIQILEQGDSDARIGLLGAVEKIAPGDPRTLPILIKLTEDSNDSVRNNACAVLSKFGPEAKAAVPALHRCLDDPADLRMSVVRFNATLALWRIAHEPPRIDILRQSLRDRDGPFLPLGILEMLRGLDRQTPETVSILRELAQYWDPEVRTNAEALLEKSGFKLEDTKAESPPAASQSATGHNVTLAINDSAPEPKIPPAFGPLVKKLRSRDRNTRLDAETEIGRMGTQASEVTPFVIPLLRDEDPEVRELAASLLGDISTDVGQVVIPLLNAARDLDPQVAVNAGESFEKIGARTGSLEPIRQALIPALNDTNALTRAAAQGALAALESKSRN